ncbi:MAG: hypothetical protein WCT37_04395 [Patescibacteria group bacterium]|jgi:hypothetical protein
MKKVIILALLTLVALAALAFAAHAEEINIVDAYGKVDQKYVDFLGKVDATCSHLILGHHFDEAHRVRLLSELGQIARKRIMDKIEAEIGSENMHEKGIQTFLVEAGRALPAYIDGRYGRPDGILSETEQQSRADDLDGGNIGLREIALMVVEYDALAAVLPTATPAPEKPGVLQEDKTVIGVE